MSKVPKKKLFVVFDESGIAYAHTKRAAAKGTLTDLSLNEIEHSEIHVYVSVDRLDK